MAPEVQSPTAPPLRMGRAPAGRIALSIAILALAVGVSYVLGGELQVGPVEFILLGAVLMVALVFGLPYALAVGALAFTAYRVFLRQSPNPFNLQPGELKVFALLTLGVVVVGFYTDRARAQALRAQTLMVAGRSLSGRAPPSLARRFFSRAWHDIPPQAGADAVREFVRAAITLLMFVGACALVEALKGLLGGAGAAMLLSVLAVAAGWVSGPRFGLVAGAAALPGLLSIYPDLRGLFHGPVEAGGVILALGVLGWGAGLVKQRLDLDDSALRTVLSTGHELTTSIDEATLRQTLVDGLQSLSEGAQVHLVDETGRVWSTPGQTAAAGGPGWRVRRLQADGRDMGEVAWRSPPALRDPKRLDEAATILSDLASAAIARARLSAEKADMEFVARTEHLRTVLLDAVSHHFRSPLAGILGAVTSVLSLPEPHDREVRREMLLIVKEQAHRLNRYVENFLNVARVESGGVQIRPAPLDLEALVYEVWESFGEAGGSRRFLQADIGCETVTADRHALAQVLGNLLENAIKYSPEGSVVEIRAEARGEGALISVSDRGPGVPPEMRERAFERFYRSPSATAPGLGLGLYIARSLARLMGGDVLIRDRADKQAGTTISITLPGGGQCTGPTPIS